MSIKEETATAAAKAALPISVSGGLIFGMPIGQAVQWVTLAFLVLQIGLLIPRYIQFIKDRWGRK